MSDIIYGQHAVLEALRAGTPLEKLCFLKEARRADFPEIRRLAQQQNIRVELISKQELPKHISPQKTQGILAFLQGHRYATVNDILARSRDLAEPPFIALLDGIEDPHNLGAILRSADGAGMHGVILPKRRAVGVTPTVARTSAGASAHILTAQVANLNYAIEELKEKGLWIVGADQDGTQSYNEADLSGPLGIVIGAEGKGLHRLVREKCDFVVRIPMYGKVNSLNASVAAALLFFEARGQRTRGREA